MNRAEYETLTPMERNCLRLAHHERKTEHIAHELGIASSTVNTHIFAARRKLGGLSRLSAADKLRAYEAPMEKADAPRPAGEHVQSARLPDAPPSPAPPHPLSRTTMPMVGHTIPEATTRMPTDVREERATFVFDAGDRASGKQDPASATFSQRIVTILAIAALAALVLIAAPTIYDSAAERIANSLERPNH